MGSRLTCLNSIGSLRKRGKHVQVGLMVGDDRQPGIPMDIIVANELEILGSHGMQAHQYSRMLDMIATKQLKPELLIGGTVDLGTAAANFGDQAGFDGAGVMVIDEFGGETSA
jgi:alcohol dehydrogenase